MVPNDTTYKRWNCYSSHKLCETLPFPAMGAQYIVRGNVINRHIVHLWHDKEINTDVV